MCWRGEHIQAPEDLRNRDFFLEVSVFQCVFPKHQAIELSAPEEGFCTLTWRLPPTYANFINALLK